MADPIPDQWCRRHSVAPRVSSLSAAEAGSAAHRQVSHGALELLAPDRGLARHDGNRDNASISTKFGFGHMSAVPPSEFDRFRSNIAHQWIKAHVVGGVVNAVVTFVAFLLSRVLGVYEAGTSAIVVAFFVVICIVALSAGVALIGFLAGVVLRQKLPDFPMRAWMALYIVLGVAVGALSAMSWTMFDPPPDAQSYATDEVVSLVVGGLIAGAMIGALAGAIQALVLRTVAFGMGRWIAFSAIAGAQFAAVVPLLLYLPPSPYASELVLDLATLVVTVIGAAIMLPAVRRLAPRP
ncbi:MAG: hypothetical protein ACRECO_18565 [Xanthobacteraceae bacterium]